jgi:hypothetical protein
MNEPNCGRKLENSSTCASKFEPSLGAVGTERGYLQLKNRLEKNLRIFG